MRGSRGFLWFGGLLVAAMTVNVAACAALESIQAGQCGNGVLELGEECDTFAPPARFGDGTKGKGVCGAQSAGAGACRFLCGQPLPDGGTDGGKDGGTDGGTETSVCPTDEVCGSDGICRPDPLAGADAGATYQFAQLGPPAATAASSLVSGDFDGDGLGDVMAITPAGSQLLLGSSKGLSFASSTQLSIHGPSAARLTGDAPSIDHRAPYAPSAADDATDDLLFLSGGGISVLTGKPGGILTPAAYSKVDVPSPFFFAGFVFGNAPSSAMGKPPPPPISTPWIFLPYDTMFENQDGDAGCTELDLAFLYIAGKPQAVKCFPHAQAKDATHVSNAVLAPLHVDPTTACGQFVMGFKDDDHVSVFVPCEAGKTTFGAWTLGSTVFPIALGSGTLSWGPLVYDVDGDGRLDVLAGAGDHMVVAYGTDTFHFTSMPNGMGTMDAAGVFDVGVKGWELVPQTKADPLRGPVLAVGDINGDHHPDFVTAQGLYVSTASSSATAEFYQAYQITAPAEVESAAFGDFNGDGLTDVAFAFKKGDGANTLGFPELVVLLTSSKQIGDLPLLDPYAVTVDAPVFHVVSGDFNGDGLADIAFGQTSDPTLHGDPAVMAPSNDTITVIYGDTGGNFSPVSMGSVSGMGGLLATDILFQGEKQYDGDSDLGVLFSYTTPNADPTKQPIHHHAAAVLAGQPGHLLLAPLGLLEVDKDRKFHEALPLAVAAGQFGSDRHLDFGTLAVETNQAGVVKDQLELWQTPLDGNALAIASTFTPLNDGLSTFGVMGDPSSVGASATSFRPGGDGEQWFVAAIAGPKGARVYFGPPIAGAGFAVKSIGLAFVPTDLGAAPTVHVEAGNIGGKATIVVLVGTQLFVISNLAERSGFEPVKFLPMVVDFALFPRPARHDSLILLATGTDVLLSDGASAQPIQGITTSNPFAVAATDVDGDRLTDVIVSSREGVTTTFRMLPTAYTGNPSAPP